MSVLSTQAQLNFQTFLFTLSIELCSLLCSSSPPPVSLDYATATFWPEQCHAVLSTRAIHGLCSWPLCSSSLSKNKSHNDETLLSITPEQLTDATLFLHCTPLCRKNSYAWYKSISCSPQNLRPEALVVFQFITGAEPPNHTHECDTIPRFNSTYKQRLSLSLFTLEKDTLAQSASHSTRIPLTAEHRLIFQQMMKHRFSLPTQDGFKFPSVDPTTLEFDPKAYFLPPINHTDDIQKESMAQITPQLFELYFRLQCGFLHMWLPRHFQTIADFMVRKYNRPMIRFQYRVNGDQDATETSLNSQSSSRKHPPSSSSSQDQAVSMEYSLAQHPIVEKKRPNDKKKGVSFAPEADTHVFASDTPFVTPAQPNIHPTSILSPSSSTSSASIPTSIPAQLQSKSPSQSSLQSTSPTSLFPNVIKSTPSSSPSPSQLSPLPPHFRHVNIPKPITKPTPPPPIEPQLTPEELVMIAQEREAKRFEQFKINLGNMDRDALKRCDEIQYLNQLQFQYTQYNHHQVHDIPTSSLIAEHILSEHLPPPPSLPSSSSTQLPQPSLSISALHRNTHHKLRSTKSHLIRPPIPILRLFFRQYRYTQSTRLRLVQFLFNLFPRHSIVHLYLIFNTRFTPHVVTMGYPHPLPWNSRDPPHFSYSSITTWFNAWNPIQRSLCKKSPLYAYQNIINRSKSKFTLGAFLRLVKGLKYQYRLLDQEWTPQKVKMKPLGSPDLYPVRIYNEQTDDYDTELDPRYGNRTFDFTLSPLPTSQHPLRGTHPLDQPLCFEQLDQSTKQLRQQHQEWKHNFNSQFSIYVPPNKSQTQFLPTRRITATRYGKPTKRVHFNTSEFHVSSTQLLHKPISKGAKLNYIQYSLLSPRFQFLYRRLASFQVATILEPKIIQYFLDEALHHHITITPSAHHHSIFQANFEQELAFIPLDRDEDDKLSSFLTTQQQHQTTQLSSQQIEQLTVDWTHTHRNKLFYDEFNHLSNELVQHQIIQDKRIAASKIQTHVIFFNPQSTFANLPLYQRMPGTSYVYPYYFDPIDQFGSTSSLQLQDCGSTQPTSHITVPRLSHPTHFPANASTLSLIDLPYTIIDNPFVFWKTDQTEYIVDHNLYNYSKAKFSAIHPFVYFFLQDGIPISEQQPHLDKLYQKLASGYSEADIEAEFHQLRRAMVTIRNTTVRPNAGHGKFTNTIRSKGDTVGSTAAAQINGPSIEVFDNRPIFIDDIITSPNSSSNGFLTMINAHKVPAPRSRIYGINRPKIGQELSQEFVSFEPIAAQNAATSITISSSSSDASTTSTISTTPSTTTPTTPIAAKILPSSTSRRHKKTTITGQDFFQRPSSLVPFIGEVEQKRLQRIQQQEAQKRQPLDPDPENYDYELGYFKNARELTQLECEMESTPQLQPEEEEGKVQIGPQPLPHHQSEINPSIQSTPPYLPKTSDSNPFSGNEESGIKSNVSLGSLLQSNDILVPTDTIIDTSKLFEALPQFVQQENIQHDHDDWSLSMEEIRFRRHHIASRADPYNDIDKLFVDELNRPLSVTEALQRKAESYQTPLDIGPPVFDGEFDDIDVIVPTHLDMIDDDESRIHQPRLSPGSTRDLLYDLLHAPLSSSSSSSSSSDSSSDDSDDSDGSKDHNINNKLPYLDFEYSQLLTTAGVNPDALDPESTYHFPIDDGLYEDNDNGDDEDDDDDERNDFKPPESLRDKFEEEAAEQQRMDSENSSTALGQDIGTVGTVTASSLRQMVSQFQSNLSRGELLNSCLTSWSNEKHTTICQFLLRNLPPPHDFDSRYIGSIPSTLTQQRLSVLRPAVTQQIVYMLDNLGLKFESNDHIVHYTKKRISYNRFENAAQIAFHHHTTQSSTTPSALLIPSSSTPLNPDQYETFFLHQVFHTSRTQIISHALQLVSHFRLDEAPSLDILFLRSLALVLIFTVADIHERQNVLPNSYTSNIEYEYSIWYDKLIPKQKQAMNQFAPSWFPQFPLNHDPHGDFLIVPNPILTHVMDFLGLTHTHLRRLSGFCFDF